MAITLPHTSPVSTDSIARTSRNRMVLATLATLAVSLGLVRLTMALDLGAILVTAVVITLLAVVVQPRYGLYAIFAVVLLFEVGSGDHLMDPGGYLSNSLQNSLNATGLILIPLELLLVLTVVAWLSQALMRRRIPFRPGSLGLPVLLLFLALVFGMVRGLASGAIFNYAFWESRFLFWMVLCYVLAANTIRTPAHVRTLLSLIMIGVGFSGVEGAWRKFALIDTGQLGTMQETWFTHESVVIWGLLLMLVFAQQAFGAPKWQRIFGPILFVITGYTMLASERRAGYIAVMVAFLAFAVVLAMTKRKAFVLIALPVILATAVYLPAFWNNTGTFGQPARAVRSLKDPDPRDANSNLSRDLEAVNVRYTIASDPLLGIGFGKPFYQVVAIPDISFFPFWNYEAHHGILWVWMKIGAVGFTLFFVVMGGGIARGAKLVRVLKHPEGRLFAMVAVTGIVMALVFSYVDLGLTSSRVPVVLGVLLGTVSVLDKIYE